MIYTILISNLGPVCQTDNAEEASAEFDRYIYAVNRRGDVQGETVTWVDGDGVPLAEYTPGVWEED